MIRQCTQNLKANLDALDNYVDIEAGAEVLALLTAIKSLVFNLESSKCMVGALVGSVRAFYCFTRPKTIMDEEFLKKYRSMYKVITQSGGRIGYHHAMIHQQLTKLGIVVTDTAGVMVVLDQCIANSEDGYSAVHFLWMLNWESQWSPMMHLENQYTLGVDAYPKILTTAYTLAIKWKKETRSDPNPTDYCKPDKGVNLATDVKKGKKQDLSNMKCFNCNKNGHFAQGCKEAKVEKPAEAVNTTTTVPPSDL